MSEAQANGGRRVLASALVSWGSMPQLANTIHYVFACQGIEPWQANADAGTRRPPRLLESQTFGRTLLFDKLQFTHTIRYRAILLKYRIKTNCSLPTRINIDPS